MFDRNFLDSKVGAAALVSIAAMLSFNIAVLCTQFDQPAEPRVFATEQLSVELA